MFLLPAKIDPGNEEKLYELKVEKVFVDDREQATPSLFLLMIATNYCCATVQSKRRDCSAIHAGNVPLERRKIGMIHFSL